MTTFDDTMCDAQIAWRGRAVPHVREHGWQNKRQYAHILPRRHWEENLWPGIRSGTTRSLPAWLVANKVSRHTGTHNLLSSWAMCANLYFPFRDDGRALLATFLRAHVDPTIETVDTVELEWADAAPRDPSTLLGEAGGSRGSGQTSPDVAFLLTLADGRPGVVLTESKFTEHSFYACSAHKKELDAAQRASDCGAGWRDGRVLDDPASACAQHRVYGRRYLDHLGPVLRAAGAERSFTACPAASGGYQLMRQQALAEALAATGRYGRVVSAVAWDARNPSLMRSMRRACGLTDVRVGWGASTQGRAGFATFSHQSWVTHVRATARPAWADDWLAWIADRYGM